MTVKITETHIKGQIKGLLGYMGIYNWPITQGIGCHRGAPDRIMHYQGKVHYLEIKLPSGKMSEYQLAFQEQCRIDGIPYHIITSTEDLEEKLREVV